MSQLSLEQALEPMSLAELREHYDEGRCLVLEGPAEKFQSLVSLGDIENRINDGCNANHFPQMIIDASRRNNVLSQCVWSPASLNKTAFREGLEAGHSFMISNSSQISPAMSSFVDELETFFEEDNVHADVHLYVSTSTRGKSYNTHRDLPQHKILLQAYGETVWQLFEPIQEIPDSLTAIDDDERDQYLQQIAEFTLSEGGLLYMPPGTFHKVIAVNKPRISISIPFYSMPQAERMDRSFIPFAKIFSSK